MIINHFKLPGFFLSWGKKATAVWDMSAD